MEFLKLRANPEHPTHKKVEDLITFLEQRQLQVECINGSLVIRDYEYCVNYNIVCEDDGRPQDDLPPTFLYKLTREKEPNKYCKCRHCDPNFKG